MNKYKANVLMLGCGNMGHPIATCLIAHNYHVEVVLPKDDPMIETLTKEGITHYKEQIPNKQYHFIIIAYKPQAIGVTAGYAEQIMATEALKDVTIISIMAGVKIATLKHFFPKHKVIRIMPNMTLKVGHGFSTYFCSEILSQWQTHAVEDMQRSFGKCYPAQSEGEIDKITVLSGSGPAYAARVIEEYLHAGLALGLSEQVVRDAIYQTFLGTLKLIVEQAQEPAQLRASITSKAGVTEAALKKLDELNFSSIIEQSVHAALKRNEELATEGNK